jgi:UDP-N-acetylglucosamine--N-acetylmuramyl-(pentapeptide) pyrophosphoryl-undecaprenol N-acetylglucosamine transferase
VTGMADHSGPHVVLAGGGTAGHIEPAMNLADALRRRDPDIGITALGTARGLETTLVPARGYDLELIPAVPLPRRPTGDLVTLPGRLRGAVAEVAALLDRLDADVVVGFGGYVALPAYLAARRRRVPIVVHEANAKPGLANRIGARFAARVTETVAGSLPDAEQVGLPLRRSIARLDRTEARPAAREALGLGPNSPTLLVFGGSQGAVHLNTVLADALPRLLDAGFQVLHLFGGRNSALRESGGGYVGLEYLDRMELAYAAADLALCRSGAMTCAEVAAVGLPAIYVPLPIGNGEQRLNAAGVVAAGGGVLVSDGELTSDALVSTAAALLSDQSALAMMSTRARAHGVRDADERLADVVLAELLPEGSGA